MQTLPACLILKLVVVQLLGNQFQEGGGENPLKNRQSKTNDSCACKGEGYKKGGQDEEREGGRQGRRRGTGPRKSLEDKNNQSHDTKAGRGAGSPTPQGEECQPATDRATGRVRVRRGRRGDGGKMREKDAQGEEGVG